MGAIISNKGSIHKAHFDKKIKNGNTSSLDTEKEIKKLLLSRNNSATEANNQSKNPLRRFYEKIKPRQFYKNKSTNSLSLKRDDYNKEIKQDPTIKDLENAFKPSFFHKKKEDDKKINIKSYLVTNTQLNDRKRQAIFPTFNRKLHEYRHRKNILNDEDVNLIEIIKNYFKNKIKLRSNSEKNQVTDDFLKRAKKPGLDFLQTDQLSNPEKLTNKQEIAILFPNKILQKSINKSNKSRASSAKKSKLILKTTEDTLKTIPKVNNEDDLWDNLNLSRKFSIPKTKESVLYHKTVTLSPHFHPYKTSTEKEVFHTAKTMSEEIEHENQSGNIFNSKNLQKPSLTKIIRQRCMIPLKFKASLKPTLSSHSDLEFKRRMSCFPDNKKILRIVEPPSSGTNKKRQEKEKQKDSSLEIKSLLNQLDNLEENDETKNEESLYLNNDTNGRIKIRKLGKVWKNFNEKNKNENLNNVQEKIKKNEIIQIEKCFQSNSLYQKIANFKVERQGKTFNVVKKNDNLFVGSKKILCILNNDDEKEKNIRKNRMLESSTEILSKLNSRNISPTSFYFFDKQEQEKILTSN